MTVDIQVRCDLSRPVVLRHLEGMIFSQDVMANRVVVFVDRDGEPETLSGSVSANIIRADGATVVQTGEVSGSVATVTLPASAYAVSGPIEIFVKHTHDGSTTTIASLTGYVCASTSNTIVDPGTVVPNINELLAMVDDCEAATAAAEAAAESVANIIDDTAGDGDTDKTWSADKLVDDFVLKAPKANPVFTGSISMGRVSESNKKTGTNSVAIGNNVRAMGAYSNVTGDNTIGMSASGHVFGEYNIPEAEEWQANKAYHVGDIYVRYGMAAGQIVNVLYFKCNTDHTSSNNLGDDSAYWDNVSSHNLKYVEIVGNGYAEMDDQFNVTEYRSNARTLDWDGNESLAGSITLGKGTTDEVTLTAAQLKQLLALLN